MGGMQSRAGVGAGIGATAMESAIFVFDKTIIMRGEVHYRGPVREGGYKADIKFIEAEIGVLSKIREYADKSGQ